MLQYPVKENFLHYLWKTKKLLLTDCVLTTGEQLEILEYGNYNTDSGPDFFNGKVKINDTIWAGNIEMHVFSSDWALHRHSQDIAYDNVILHVVYEHDKVIFRADQSIIPTLELKGKIPLLYLENYLKLQQSSQVIPCAYAIDKTDKEKLHLWLYKLVVERLERKVIPIQTILEETSGSWEECIFRLIARYMGTRVNGEAFELLAKSIPRTVLLKNQDNIQIIEALLFGQAGMLEAEYKDKYYTDLKKEYHYQKTKYALSSTPGVMWKFNRMRPANFPTVRIAQLASLIHYQGNIFDKIVKSNSGKEIRSIFRNPVSDYWRNHYKFDHRSEKNQSGNMSDEMVDLIIINVVAPVLFVYGKSIGEEIYTDKAITWLENTTSEKNAIIKTWEGLGFKAKKAYESQAFIQLRNEYCNKKRCLECSIGHQLLGI